MEIGMIGFGFTFNSDGEWEVNKLKDLDYVRASLRHIVETIIGERPMVPGFGSVLYTAVFEPLNATLLGRIRETVKASVKNWSSGVIIDSVELRQDEDDNTLVYVMIKYRLNAAQISMDDFSFSVRGGN